MSMDERLHHLFARMPEAKVHLYGKAERPGRKIGHVNVLGAAPTLGAQRGDAGGALATRRHMAGTGTGGPTDGTGDGVSPGSA